MYRCQLLFDIKLTDIRSVFDRESYNNTRVKSVLLSIRHKIWIDFNNESYPFCKHLSFECVAIHAADQHYILISIKYACNGSSAIQICRIQEKNFNKEWKRNR